MYAHKDNIDNKESSHDLAVRLRKQEISKKNLNELKCPDDSRGGYSDFEVNNVSTKEISVYFRGLEDRLVSHILQADYVCGAIAWLTSEKIIKAMAKTKHGAQIVVQKEDFLRPDIGCGDSWKSHLRSLYSLIRNGMDRLDFGNLVGDLSYASDPIFEGVRCVGNYNSDKKPAFPRMHNKFLLFANIEDANRDSLDFEEWWDSERSVLPYAVWTGSFNFTKNATFSLENALYITNKEIVKAYFDEYAQIVALSEPLDWKREWIEPEYRVGT